jgi:hypothetical protein
MVSTQGQMPNTRFPTAFMKILRTILTATLVFVSLINAAQAVWSSYLMLPLEPNPIPQREASVLHMREVLNGLGILRISYVAGPGSDISDGWKLFENQFLLAPVVLKPNSPHESFVLVNLGDGNPAVPMPGLTLVEDFDNGFALFRKAP